MAYESPAKIKSSLFDYDLKSFTFGTAIIYSFIGNFTGDVIKVKNT